MPNTLKFPDRASEDAKAAIRAIRRVVGAERIDDELSGWAFKTPEEWKERGEQFGHGSVLIVVHDGPPLNTYFNLDYCADAHIEKLWKALGKIGMRAEQCTSWYSAIYRD